MRTQFLTAIIVDQDASQGRSMAILLKDLFNKIHQDSQVESLIKECSEIKPRVIFFNLSVAQRTQNFEILERLPVRGDSQTTIFGYTDTHEPELIAHAIEMGFHDIFIKPFDAEIVATKINKFFQFEKTQGREINHQQLRPGITGELSLNLQLTSVDENGLSFKSPNYISKGSVFKLSSPLIQEIFEVREMDFMITRTWLGDNWNEHFFFAELQQPSEKWSASLRKFILRKL